MSNLEENKNSTTYQAEFALFGTDNILRSRGAVEVYVEKELDTERLVNTISFILTKREENPMQNGEYFIITKIIKVDEEEEDLF